METVYTTSATSTGGRFEGRVRADRGAFELGTNAPGQGEGTNPEELFAAGYAACFASAFLLGARRAQADPSGVEVTAEVTLGKEDDGGFGLAVQLRVNAPNIPQAQADELIAAAHEGCPYSKATRGNIDVGLEAVGGA
jgi:osmotically inducible protein OsmC